MMRPFSYVEDTIRILGELPFQPAIEQARDDMSAMLTELRAKKKTDRSALMRMAGNIASGLAANNMYSISLYSSVNDRDLVAEAAVDIATRIMARIDARKE